MAIASSGAVSFSDLRTEYVGGSSAISYSDLYRGGSNIKTKAGDNPATNLAASVPTSGAIDLADFHGTAKGFKNTISSNTTNVDANALFGDDYDVNYPKVIDVNSGVTIGGSGDEALDIPSGLAGTLVINNAGNIYGYGGAAGGGAGGSAINCATSNVTINNTGEIRGGGGGGNTGGTGGAGGGGTYNSTVTAYVHYIYGGHTSVAENSEGGDWYWRWNGTALPSSGWGGTGGYLGTWHTYGGYTYGRGSYKYGSGGTYQYEITRTGPTSTSGGAGGAGGAGGQGQGYGQSAGTGATGSNGAAGGTSAGTGGQGGTGGDGGAWATAGSNGATGATGANGNASNGVGGLAGGTGGAAGQAVIGTSVVMNNTGTISGTVA